MPGVSDCGPSPWLGFPVHCHSQRDLTALEESGITGQSRLHTHTLSFLMEFQWLVNYLGVFT